MANSFNKRELQKKKQGKKLEKQQRKEQRKSNKGSGSLDDMIAYVDANGAITDVPPEISIKSDIDVETIVISTPKKEAVEIIPIKGRIEHFNSSKGYGFIKDCNDEKFFFHVSNTSEGITEGVEVTFETEYTTRGQNAIKIKLIK